MLPLPTVSASQEESAERKDVVVADVNHVIAQQILRTKLKYLGGRLWEQNYPDHSRVKYMSE